MNKDKNALFAEEVRAVMAVPDMDAERDAKLEAHLRQEMRRMRARKDWRMRRGLRFSFAGWAATIVMVLFLTVLAIGPQKVWAAVRSLGFLPGIGYVQDDVRVLDESVQVQRGETTAVLSALVSDSENTWLRVVISGELDHDLPLKDQCLAQPVLAFGETQPFRPEWSAITAWETEEVLELSFPVLPSDEQNGMLILPCLPGVPAELNREDWVMPFMLRLPAEGEKPYPAETLASPAVTTNQSEGERQESAADTQTDAGVKLTVDNVVELEDGYQFMGTVSGPQDGDFTFNSEAIRLQTLDGEPIALQPVDVPFGSGIPGGVQPWVLRTDTKDLPAQLVFVLQAIGHKRSDEEVQGQRVSVDLGADPQVGQSWAIDQTITVAGYAVTFREVSLEQVAPDVYLLMFRVEYPQDAIYGMDLADVANPIPEMEAGSGGGGGGGGSEVFVNLRLETIAYDQIPNGVHTFYVAEATIAEAGQWSTEVHLPE